MKTALRIALAAAVLTAIAGLSVNVFLSSLLIVLVLALVLRSTAASGWTSVSLLFVLYCGVGYLSTLAEAVLFHVMPWPEALRALGAGAGQAFCASLLVGALFDRFRIYETAARPLRTGLGWRIPLLAMIYFALYFIAGATIFPFVRDFYAGKPLPSFAELFLVQIIRGALLAGFSLPLLRYTTGTRRRAAWLLAVAFPILGGIAPLLLQNQYMPAHVRLAHAVEIGWSNLVFGLLTGWLLCGADDRLSSSAGAGQGPAPLP